MLNDAGNFKHANQAKATHSLLTVANLAKLCKSLQSIFIACNFACISQEILLRLTHSHNIGMQGSNSLQLFSLASHRHHTSVNIQLLPRQPVPVTLVKQGRRNINLVRLDKRYYHRGEPLMDELLRPLLPDNQASNAITLP
jgi:hypothetical protein